MLTTEYLYGTGLSPVLATIEWGPRAGRLWCATSPLARRFRIPRDAARDAFASLGAQDTQLVSARDVARLGLDLHSPRGQTLATIPAVCRVILGRDDVFGLDESVYKLLDLARQLRVDSGEELPAATPAGLMFRDLYSAAWVAHEQSTARRFAANSGAGEQLCLTA